MVLSCTAGPLQWQGQVPGSIAIFWCPAICLHHVINGIMLPSEIIKEVPSRTVDLCPK